MAITISRALPEQAARLTQIAHAAKSYWAYPAQWIELWHNQLTITAAYLQAHEAYVALDDGVALGFYALLGQGDTLVLDHLWVDPRALHSGIGRMLFEHAVVRAAELSATRIEIESDPNAEGFYQKMGAETIGEVTYELEGMPRSLPLMAYALRGPAPKAPDEAPAP